MQHISAQSKGKVIISGEHSVVYGQPALVGSIGLFRETVLRNPGKRKIDHSQFIANVLAIFAKEYDVDTSNIEVIDLGKLPVGSGLGSSAAYAHAVFLSLLKYFNKTATKDELFNLVQESERFAHGNPSGVDASAVVYGGLLEFIRGEKNILRTIDQGEGLKKKQFFLIDSGRPVESTKQMVEHVATQLQQRPRLLKTIQTMGQLTREISATIIRDDFNYALLNQNHALLDQLGVVSDKANEMITLIRSVGGYGKITGAGGITAGSGMILASASDHDKIADLIKENNWKSYQVHIG